MSSIKMTFQSEDHRALDSFVRDVILTVIRAGGSVEGPIPLPTKVSRATPKTNSYLGSLLADPKKETCIHTRLMAIHGVTPKVMNSLDSLKTPGAVSVKIS